MKSKPNKKLIYFTATIIISLTSALIFAQEEESTEGTNNDNLLALTTSTFGTLDREDQLLCATASGLLLTSSAVTIIVLSRAGARTNQIVLRDYITRERESLHAAHAAGGGPATDDLATLLWLPTTHRWMLGAAMRQERRTLNATLEQTCEDAATCDALADRYIATLLDAIHARPEAHEPIPLSP
jgi:hypothetical protein